MDRPRHPQSPDDSARRIALLLLTLLTAYVGFVALVLMVVWRLPRDTVALGPMQLELVFEGMVAHGIGLAVAAPAMLVLRRRRNVATRTPKLILLLTLVCVLASADRIVGIFFPPPLPARTIYALHAARGWTNRPNSVAPFSDTVMRIDALGLRVDEESGQEDLTDRKRVLFVGDSVTLAYYHPARAAYGWQAVDVLRKRHPAARLVSLNAGICGYDTRQECHWLIHEGLALRPDLVVLQFCFNDLTTIYDPAGGIDQDKHPIFAWAAPPTSRSGIRRAIRETALRLRFGKDLQAAAERIEHFEVQQLLSDDTPPKIDRAWRTVFGQLELFFETCRQAGVPVALVCFPVKDQIADPGASTVVQDRLRGFAEEHDVPFLDLLPVYTRTLGTGETAAAEAFQDTTHPTVRGHRIAGEATATFIESSGLLNEWVDPQS